PRDREAAPPGAPAEGRPAPAASRRHRAATAASARRRRAGIELAMVVLYGGESAVGARVRDPAAGRHNPRHGELATRGRIPPPLRRKTWLSSSTDAVRRGPRSAATRVGRRRR